MILRRGIVKQGAGVVDEEDWQAVDPFLDVNVRIAYPLFAMNDDLSIGGLAAKFDTSERAIRLYEDHGLLTPARRGNRRIYGIKEETRLKLILRGKRLGFSLEEIGEILSIYDMSRDETAQAALLISKIRRRRDSLKQQRADIDAILNELDAVEAECTDVLVAQADGVGEG